MIIYVKFSFLTFLQTDIIIVWIFRRFPYFRSARLDLSICLKKLH